MKCSLCKTVPVKVVQVDENRNVVREFDMFGWRKKDNTIEIDLSSGGAMRFPAEVLKGEIDIEVPGYEVLAVTFTGLSVCIDIM